MVEELEMVLEENGFAAAWFACRLGVVDDALGTDFGISCGWGCCDDGWRCRRWALEGC